MKQHATRVGTLNGYPVYKDHNGDLCIECNGFQHLRYLTDEEEAKLLTVSRQLKNQVMSEDSEDSEAL